VNCVIESCSKIIVLQALLLDVDIRRRAIIPFSQPLTKSGSLFEDHGMHHHPFHSNKSTLRNQDVDLGRHLIYNTNSKAAS